MFETLFNDKEEHNLTFSQMMKWLLVTFALCIVLSIVVTAVYGYTGYNIIEYFRSLIVTDRVW